MVDDRRFGPALAVADAVLYEGYLLYPYRRSSGKNKVRWQFGVLAPPSWVDGQGVRDHGVSGAVESDYQQTECLVRAPVGARLHVQLRFLQLQRRRVQRVCEDGGYRDVDLLETDGEVHLSFEEAVPCTRETSARVDLLDEEPRRVEVHVPGGRSCEPLRDSRGRPVGRVLREREPLQAALCLSASGTGSRAVARVRVRVEHAGSELVAAASREHALAHSLLASHLVLAVDGGEFLSLMDPPATLAEAASTCCNVHTFPVLVASGPEHEPDRADLVLSSPILLEDFPAVAPESPGDLHDAAEIDEVLSLRTLTLTDREKREVRATDRRVAAILDRVEAMGAEPMQRLHGALRSVSPPPVPQQPAWWEPGGDDGVYPEQDSVVVRGAAVSRGSRVRLRPRGHGGDPHDMFLTGRLARVERVLLDVDGSRQVAVTLLDDPGADLFESYRRYWHFAPEEIEVVGPDGAA